MNRLLQYGVGVGVDVRLSVSLLVGCLLAWFFLVWWVVSMINDGAFVFILVLVNVIVLVIVLVRAARVYVLVCSVDPVLLVSLLMLSGTLSVSLVAGLCKLLVGR